MSKPECSCNCKFAHHMEHPEHQGEFCPRCVKDEKLIVADYHSKCCGNAIRLSLLVDSESKVIDAKYQMFGCAKFGVLADVLCGLCIGKKMTDLLMIKNLDIEKQLQEPKVPKEPIFSTSFFYRTIQRAISIYTGKKLCDIENEDLVCLCGNIPLATIKTAIKEKDLKTVEEITKETNAGSFCGSCQRAGAGEYSRKYYLEDILRETRAEMECTKTCEKTCEKATFYQKVMKINEVFNEKIGCCKENKINIFDIKESEGGVAVLIQIEGKCCGCCEESIKKRDEVQAILREAICKHIIVMVVPCCCAK
ncbi:nitrogen fixation protein nifU, putative [Entamoeba invadens IP1]|uniref:Nitrogen fixation protein nifU, putative n=1 Tax=Entamoeba invadens IP1 TaxID=370355 RepID=A0A0A1U0G4_ENTIV|nr:nitrogen fixation protein nifU, putative [Entamoeba invadens IP1]ELP85991.1 nitrogen fixation protein nifU, putative [Entamoeba invadens IP1]|eukprot:XP_004185337.1 nitrogen fixation protein nifU, putative [Entamoeba invadens IP1]